MRRGVWILFCGMMVWFLTVGSVLAAPPIPPAAPPVAPPAPVFVRHLVRRGETLIGIAARYGVSVAAIVQANGIRNRNLIYAGQVLRIPQRVPARPAIVVHVVRYGETLSAIAARYRTSVWEIARLNGLLNLNLIFVGQRLLVPNP